MPRFGVSAEVRDTLLPKIDHQKFLNFDEKGNRAILYLFAISIAVVNSAPPTKPRGTQSLVREDSVTPEVDSKFILFFLAAQESIEGSVRCLEGDGQMKYVEWLDSMANSGFDYIREEVDQPYDTVLNSYLERLDQQYKKLSENYPELNLPPFHKFGMGH